MQTFLPYASFARSAEVLDRERLGKQRSEVLQILKALDRKRRGIKAGWQSHTAVKLWEPFPELLIPYGKTICREWMMWGYNDTTLNKIARFERVFGAVNVDSAPFSEALYASHRAALLEKLPAHYGTFGWNEIPKIDYVWR